MIDDEELEIIESPFSGAIEKDGQTVQVFIYGDGEGQWLLEVVDIFDNSTVWDDRFESDTSAYEEVMRTIEEEGIESLIGTPDKSMQ